MEFESETSFSVKNDFEYKRYSDEKTELDQIRRKELHPQCMIYFDSVSNNENSKDIKQEPDDINLSELCEKDQFSNIKTGSDETSRISATLDNISNTYILPNDKNLTERTFVSKDSIFNSPEISREIGADTSDIVQNIILSRHLGISPLQCSECDLECPSLPALELHTKLHILERIGQSSGIETILKSLASQEASEGTSYSNISSENYEERPHKCDECGFRFTIAAHLKRHMRTHTGDKPYACTECDFRCARNDKLKSHMQSHIAEQNIYDTHLVEDKNVDIKTKSLDSQEAREETSYRSSGCGYSGERPHKCDECGFRFTIAAHLKRHMLTHTGDKPYACSECDYRCARSDKLKKHMSHCKGKRLVDTHLLEATSLTNNFISGYFGEGLHKEHMLTQLTSNCFSCTQCDYTCSKKAQLTRHILTHTGEKLHACPICDYKCNDKGNLDKHFVIHIDDKPFSCSEEGCDFKCKLKANLKTHMLKHTDEQPYSCHLCDYRSKFKANLKTHMFRHSGEKPFPCSVCGNRYALKGDLTVHMRIHTNKKEIECQQCDYRCITQKRLDQHMVTHTGEKNHKCNECGFKFRSSSHLKRHMLKHTGEKKHKCDECGFKFRDSSHLKRHMRTHTKDKPYACTECDYRSARTDKLKIHMQTHINRQKPFACKVEQEDKPLSNPDVENEIMRYIIEATNTERLSHDNTPMTSDIEIQKTSIIKSEY